MSGGPVPRTMEIALDLRALSGLHLPAVHAKKKHAKKKARIAPGFFSAQSGAYQRPPPPPPELPR